MVVCASFPIPSVVDTPIIDTLLNTNTITPEPSDTLQSDSTINSGWITGQEPEKYSKDWVLGKGEKKSFWRTLWRSHVFLWVWSHRILVVVMGVVLLILSFLLEVVGDLPIELLGLWFILLALTYLWDYLEIWPFNE